MSAELDKVYDPKAVEGAVYESWQRAGAFDAEPGAGGDTFCIVIPPPNVTDVLHLGHALNNTLQDVLVRWKRMQQYNTLWMPGTDHAGIATQTVVEKRLQAEEGKRRTDLGREDFVARVQAWKDQYEVAILNQLRLMGCSCDWRRTRFTMDEVCARAVRENFFKLFADGLIYRGKRLVNWDPATQTVLADDEVEHETVQGHFWYLRYPLVEPVEFAGQRIEQVTVATTRPETMLGDTAVAMNPADGRAEALIGRKVRLPIVGRIIPIIADEHVVLPDPEGDDEKARFSTGFLKVTPAHDPDDWQIGQRAGLDVINVMAPDGTISDRHGWDDATAPEARQLLGMDRFDAREAIVEWFRQEKLLADVREYAHEVGHSYRSHVPIEPYLSDQWYIAVKKQIPHLPDGGLIDGTDVPANSLAGLALKPLLDGRLRFVPERYAKTYQAWLEGLRDWPISRQLWWGHRIPIWSRRMSWAQWLKSPGGVGDAAVSLIAVPPEGGVCIHVVRDDGHVYTLAGSEHAYQDVVELRDYHDPNEDMTWYACLRDGNAPLQTIKPRGDRTWDQAVEDDARRDQDWIGNRPDQQSPFDVREIPAGELLAGAGFVQDPDVLDTWFSSALWPFSTMGWPERTPELKAYYPGDVLCTAREIITLWVSRMVMMGQYCVGDIPFPDVFIHAMIQDGEGRKMSKSLGNGIDPLDIIDSHGADAMRFTLVGMTTQTQDVRMPVKRMTLPDGRTVNTSEKFDLGRNFCNKLWNASRFVLMNLAGCPPWSDVSPRAHPEGTVGLADRWILSRLNAAVRDVSRAMEGYRFNEVGDALYHFTWDDFCDWYVEIAKDRIRSGESAPKAILAHCLDIILRLLHPVAPFITEAIWSRLNEAAPRRGPGDAPAEPLLVRARWPRADAGAGDAMAERQFALLQDLVRQARNVRTQHNVPAAQTCDAIVEAAGPVAELLAANVQFLKSQARLGEVTIANEPVTPPTAAAAVAAGDVKLYILGLIDREAERARLGKQVEKLTRGIKGVQGKLDNENFLAKAPGEVIQRERARLESLRAELAAVRESLDGLG